MTTLTWKTEKRKIKDLQPYPGNPRKITKDAMEKLKQRIVKRGFHDILKIDTDGVILSGNQRREALLQLVIDFMFRMFSVGGSRKAPMRHHPCAM